MPFFLGQIGLDLVIEQTHVPQFITVWGLVSMWPRTSSLVLSPWFVAITV